jgi:hypothetical protein
MGEGCREWEKSLVDFRGGLESFVEEKQGFL